MDNQKKQGGMGTGEKRRSFSYGQGRQNPSAGRTPEKKHDAELRLRRIREQQQQRAREGVKKHFAKAAGVKSVFYIKPNELYMTAFGKGSAVKPEKLVTGQTVRTISDTPEYSAVPNTAGFAINGRLGINAEAGNPLRSSKAPGSDLIGLKAQLEREFFGAEFEDNIHIQIAHNIQDINKILAVHINNIVYCINNMLRDEKAEYYDIVGYLGLGKTWEQFKNPGKDANKELPELVQRLLTRPQLSCYGDVLYDVNLVKKLAEAKGAAAKQSAQAELDKKHQDAYNLLTLLGTLRQAVAHGQLKTRAAIYTLDAALDSEIKELTDSRTKAAQRLAARQTLQKLYADKVNSLNKGFLKNARVDLAIIFSVFGAQDSAAKTRLTRAYYDFVVRKEFKNLGFSLTRLRENIIINNAPDLLNTTYDSMRGRLYRHIDFIFYSYYMNHPKATDELVNKLRACMTGEEKEEIYIKEAARIWQFSSDRVTKGLLPYMSGSKLGYMSKGRLDADITPQTLNGIALSPNASTFTQLVYLMTCFLDGKEINDLLTTLINKLDNINSLMDALKQRELPSKFTGFYSIFENCATLSREMRAVNSFARMQGSDEPKFKLDQFVEAAMVLGYPGSEEQLRAYAQSVLDKNKPSHDFRNFIASNVIESDRFKYLARYCNVRKIREIANNAAVVGFALKGIPDTQIVRYYNSCMGTDLSEIQPDMRTVLRDKITGISFESFKGVVNKTSNSNKAQKQALISLYLTVLYLTVKNLVYVNSRYSLAFHCLERDALSFDSKKYKPSFDRDGDIRAFAIDRVPVQYAEKPGKLAQRRDPSQPLSPTSEGRVREYMLKNIENSDRWAARAFRNCAEHLGAVRNAYMYIGGVKHFDSWFELYHYLVQRYLKDQYLRDSGKENPIISDEQMTGKTLEYFKLAEQRGSYSKDFVKALCVPFAYNLPRFKNLSINDLFDRNSYLPEKGGAGAIKPE